MSNEKLYGDATFGDTLQQLKAKAELAKTVDGVSFEGDPRKVSAILACAGSAHELIAEIESLRARLDDRQPVA